MRIFAHVVIVVFVMVSALLVAEQSEAISPSDCGVLYLNSCQHWAGTSAERVVGVKYVNIDPNLVASVLAEWSRSPVIELRLVGPGDYASCLWTQDFERGVITVCGDGNYGECCPMGWIGTFITDDYPNPLQHITGASVHVVSYYGAEKMRHSLCHEIGHAIGLNHPTVVTPGCMGGGDVVNGDTLPWQCPDARDFALLADLYGHVDSYSTLSPLPPVTIGGALYCGVAPSPTPTPTATPTASPTPSPTPTATPSPSPTVTPSPTATSSPTPSPSATPTATASPTPTATPCHPPAAKRCKQGAR